MWSLIISSTHKDLLCLETCLQSILTQRIQCQGLSDTSPLIHQGFSCVEPIFYPVFVFSSSSKKEDRMKAEYLSDGSLDRHGVNPGDRGIPSVLQAGSCKREAEFFSQITFMTDSPLAYSSDWWKSLSREIAKKNEAPKKARVRGECGRRKAGAAGAGWRCPKIAAAVSK